MKTLLVLLTLTASARAAEYTIVDPFESLQPVYGPEAPHPIATDCGVSDTACVSAYDGRVLTLALVLGDPEVCARATQPNTCHDVYAMTFDERITLPAITECSWIYQLGQGQAILLMPLTGRVARVAARPGWSPRTYIGNCSALPKGFSMRVRQ